MLKKHFFSIDETIFLHNVSALFGSSSHLYHLFLFSFISYISTNIIETIFFFKNIPPKKATHLCIIVIPPRLIHKLRNTNEQHPIYLLFVKKKSFIWYKSFCWAILLTSCLKNSIYDTLLWLLLLLQFVC